MKILNAFTLVIYAVVLSVFLSYSANAAGTVTYSVQLMASQKQLQTTDAVFKGVTDIHEETFTTGPVKYKYTTGWTNSWKEVKETWQKMVDAGFTGAFIITYNSGNRYVKNTTTTTDGTATTWNTTTPTDTKTTANGNTVTMTTKKVTKTTTWVNPDGTPATTAPETTTTTTVADATPNTTSGTTIFTTEDGKTISMTTKKVAGSTTQYETTTTTAPTSANTNWNNTTTDWNTTTPTTTTATGTTTTTTPNTTHVYRGYGEKLNQADPTFPGGDNGLYVWIRNNLSYVLQTQSTGEWKHGTLVFTVDRTGKTINPMMMEGISKDVDAAAIRMVNNMPNWNPATVAGTPVDKQFILPLDCFIPAPIPTTSNK
jgi:hypothetical protein